jgi:hypothetical protein
MFTTFLLSGFFANFVVPLLTVGLNVYIKVVSRNDKHKPFHKEDLAIGFDLAIGAILAVSVHTIVLLNASRAAALAAQKTGAPVPPLPDKLIILPVLLIFWVLGLWGTSTLVRKFGWESEEKLTWKCGILIPFAFGVLSLIVAVNWMRS